MTTLTCELCNYETQRKMNYTRHINSEKHKEKVNKKAVESQLHLGCILVESKSNGYKCHFCNKEYSTAGNLAKHIKLCNSKKLLEDEFSKKELEYLNLLKEEKNKTEYYKALYENEMKVSSILSSENKNLRIMLNNAGTVVKTSVSTMSYIIRNYSEAPVLEGPKNIASLHYEKTPKEFVDRLIYEYRHNTLIAYIGDMILKDYKKEDPKQQAIWNSDTARLTYIIRELYNKNADWRVDKKGIKTTQCIIKPVLDYITEKVYDYIDKIEIATKDNSTKNAVEIMMNLKHANEIIQMIDDKIMEEEVLKYMAPHLFLVKDGDLLIEK
ncbi:zinc finger protein C2H2-type protein [Fadolivirus algeromassiliense]|jgi:hypothetical protein|uniref:Zinc finger protein C2H2-type protein n=1 Tax=Fadolivirus FV1/VV64 TaxID=3070911 RepID=A0A7D3R0A9_9VIRU|nr:zinc finger protein C2H2-type protein [Fadolivirus algeromassiliense]QKF93521.1 zinc finger protein C2H2-type protein [Fadolivirus FV1/VV64]